MGIQITNECINCGACVADCPQNAIFEGSEHYHILPSKCNMCKGEYESPKCVADCPIDCIIINYKDSFKTKEVKPQDSNSIKSNINMNNHNYHSIVAEEIFNLLNSKGITKSNDYNVQILYYLDNISIDKIKIAKDVFGLDIHDQIYYLVDTTITHFFSSDEISLCIFTDDFIYLYSAFLKFSDGESLYYKLKWGEVDDINLIEGEYVFYVGKDYYRVPNYIVCGNHSNQQNILSLMKNIANRCENTDKIESEKRNNELEKINESIKDLIDENNNYTDPEKTITLADKMFELQKVNMAAFIHKTDALNQLERYRETLSEVDNFIRILLIEFKCESYEKFKNKLIEINDVDYIICINFQKYYTYLKLNMYENALLANSEIDYLMSDFNKDDGYFQIYNKFISQLLEKDVNSRKIIYATENLLPYKSKSFVNILSDVKTELSFPMGLPPVDGEIYVAHPYVNNLYFHISDYEKILFLDKQMEVNYLLQCLGAKRITTSCLHGEDLQEYNKKSFNAGSEIGFVKSFKASGGKETEKNKNSTSLRGIEACQEFRPTKAPYIPNNLIWFKHDVVLQKLAEQRMEGNILKSTIKISTKEVDIISNNEKKNFEAEFKMLIGKIGGNYSDEKVFSSKKDTYTEWQIDVEFEPKELLGTESAPKIESKNQPVLNLSPEEEEYVNFLKESSSMGEITEQSRRILERMRKKLNISENKALILETEIIKSIKLTNSEKEYYDEVIFCLEDDGIISEEERKYLNSISSKSEISNERAREIENLATQNINSNK